MIELKALSRDYKFKEKVPGFKGTLNYLFRPQKQVKQAVKQWDLEIGKGELVGLIGPNGAGKTTLIKMMTGIIPPSSGTVKVCGFTPSRLEDDFRRKYALIMGQKSQLWWDLPASDSFLLNKEIYQIPEDRFQTNLEHLTSLFKVKDYVNKQVRQLSLGQRMKMEIIASLLHDPEVIFLDEPTIGLDGVAQKQIRNLLKEVNRERNTTVLLTSHYMEDIRHVCQRIIVINEGENVYDGSYSDLVSKVSPFKLVEVRFEKASTVSDDLPVEFLERNPYKIKMKVGREAVKQVVATLFQKYDIEDLSIEEEDISDVVEKIYSRS